MAPNSGHVFLLRGFGCRQREWVTCQHTPNDAAADAQSYELAIQPSFHSVSTNVRFFPSNWCLEHTTGVITLSRSGKEPIVSGRVAPKPTPRTKPSPIVKNPPPIHPQTPKNVRINAQPVVVAAAVAAAITAPVKLEHPVPVRNQVQVESFKNGGTTKPKPLVKPSKPIAPTIQQKPLNSDIPMTEPPRTTVPNVANIPIKVEQPASRRGPSLSERTKVLGSIDSDTPAVQPTLIKSSPRHTPATKVATPPQKKAVGTLKEPITSTSNGDKANGSTIQPPTTRTLHKEPSNSNANIGKEAAALPKKRHSNEPSNIAAENKRMKTSSNATEKEAPVNTAHRDSRPITTETPLASDMAMSDGRSSRPHTSPVDVELGEKFVWALVDGLCHFARSSSVLMPKKLKDKHVYLDKLISELPLSMKPKAQNQTPTENNMPITDVVEAEPLIPEHRLEIPNKDDLIRSELASKSRSETTTPSGTAEKDLDSLLQIYKRWSKVGRFTMDGSILLEESKLFERCAWELPKKTGYRFIRASLVLSHLVEFPNCTKCLSDLANMLQVMNKQFPSTLLDNVTCVIGRLTQYALALSTRVSEIFGVSLKSTKNSPKAAKILDAYASFTKNCEEMKSKDGEFLASILKKLYNISLGVTKADKDVSQKLEAIGESSKQSFSKLKLIFRKMKEQDSPSVSKIPDSRSNISRPIPVSTTKQNPVPEHAVTGSVDNKSIDLKKRSERRLEIVEASGQVSRHTDKPGEVIEDSGRIPRRSEKASFDEDAYSIRRRDETKKGSSSKAPFRTTSDGGPSRGVHSSQRSTAGPSNTERFVIPKLPIPHPSSSLQPAFLSARPNESRQRNGERAQNGQRNVPRSAPPRFASKPVASKQLQASKPVVPSKPSSSLTNGFPSMRLDKTATKGSRPAARKVLCEPGQKKNNGQRKVVLPSLGALEVDRQIRGLMANQPKAVLETLFSDFGHTIKSSLLDSTNEVQKAAIAERAEQMTLGSVVAFYGMVREFVRATTMFRKQLIHTGVRSAVPPPEFVDVPDVRMLEQRAKKFEERARRQASDKDR